MTHIVCDTIFQELKFYLATEIELDVFFQSFILDSVSMNEWYAWWFDYGQYDQCDWAYAWVFEIGSLQEEDL